MNGLDESGITLQMEEEIARYEQTAQKLTPWLSTNSIAA
jgi:3-isopropylmalate dehydratase small subunit